MSYKDDAREDAKEMARNFIDEIVVQVVDGKEISDDVNNDYPDGDSYHHETHVDRSYSLTEASEALDDLNEYEETDKGLWEGLDPREAISCQAAFTYGNAVWSLWSDLVKELNGEDWTPLVKGKKAEADTKRVKAAIEKFLEAW